MTGGFMAIFKIERCQLHARVWEIEAESEEEALEDYINEPTTDDYHFGPSDVQLQQIKRKTIFTKDVAR
jgi:hypothetical protein